MTIPGAVSGGFLGDAAIELVDRGWVGAGFVFSQGNGGLMMNINRGATSMRGWHVQGRSSVDALEVHVPNFHMRRDDDQDIVANNWRIAWRHIRPSPGEALKQSGGYAFTHVASLERSDGQPFDPEEALALLSRIDRALSFALGRWTCASLAVGRDRAGTVLWENWRLLTVDPCGFAHSWYPPDIPSTPLKCLLPGFLAAFEDDITETALRSCVHWYVEANAAALEAAITMTMIGFELLAWLELVSRRQCMASENFERLPASDKVRTYLSFKGIGIAIQPGELPQFEALIASENDCPDGVVALTRIRNRTVHPPRRGTFTSYPLETLEQTWRYGLGLLEQSLLVESGYRGWIHDRVASTARQL